MRNVRLVATAKEAEQIKEQVDEVEVEAECAESRNFAQCFGRIGISHHVLDFLSIPSCQTDENAYANDADNPVESAACQEDVDNDAYKQSDKSHHQDRAKLREVGFGGVAVDSHCTEYAGCNQECLED